MVNNFQSGLQTLSNNFLPEDKAKGNVAKRTMKKSAMVKMLNPQVEIPYTYLMAWLIMHCPFLMTAADYYPMNKPFFMEMYEHSIWMSHYMLVIRKTLQHYQDYEINRYSPDFPNNEYGSRLKDAPKLDNFSTLPSGAF